MKYKRMEKQQLLSREVLKVAHDKQSHKFSPHLFLVKEAFLIFSWTDSPSASFPPLIDGKVKSCTTQIATSK